MVDEVVFGLLSGGVKELKKPLGRPSAVSSSIGGVLIRTASWCWLMMDRSQFGMESRICTYIAWKLTDGGSETVLKKGNYIRYNEILPRQLVLDSLK